MKVSTVVKRSRVVQLVCLILIACTGCASYVGLGPQAVPIKSIPEGAKLEIIDMRTGNKVFAATTPSIVMLKRGAGYFKKARYKVTMEKEGFASREIILEGSANNWYLYGNLSFLVFGLAGWLIVDPATGAMWTLKPDDVSAELVRNSSFFDGREGVSAVNR